MNSRRLKLQARGFTFLEMLAVLSLIAIVFALATMTFTAGKARLSNASYQFTQDVQTLYADSIKTGKIHRIRFNEKLDGYTLDIFEMPKPRPSAEEREALERWEKEQKEIEEGWKDKDQSNLTRLDRGLFRTLKKRAFSDSIKVKTLLTTASLQDESTKSQQAMLFYPSGEVDQTLLVLEDSSEKIVSLQVNALSGRVKTIPGEVTKDQWKKELGIK